MRSQTERLRKRRALRRAELQERRCVFRLGGDLGRLSEDVRVGGNVGVVAGDGSVTARADAVEEIPPEALSHDFARVKLHFLELMMRSDVRVLRELNVRFEDDRSAAWNLNVQ